MSVAISLGIVQGCAFAFLSLLCLAIYAGMRGQTALAWLAVALLCASVEVLIITVARNSTAELIAATLLVPTAYLCVGRAIGIVTGRRRSQRRVFGIVATLTGLAMLLLMLGAPFIHQTLPFQLACAIAAIDGVICLSRAKDRTPIDIGLIATLSGIAAIFLVRIPLYPVMFDAATPLATVNAWPVEMMFMMLSGLLGITSVFLLLARIIGGVIATYRTRSERDWLTGLLNRQAFEQGAEAYHRGGGAVILCDIDHFKQVNDRYGHHMGDEVIRYFASLLQRTGHRAGRIGGEEFAVLLPGRSADEAAALADAIRAEFQASALPGIAPNHQLSASFGIAEYAADELPRLATVRADTALYRAKESGRDRVATFAGGETTAKGVGRCWQRAA